MDRDTLSTYIVSLDQLIYCLTQEFPYTLPDGAMLFSMDAVGMYSNIDTAHALKVVEKYIKTYNSSITDFNMPIDFITQCINCIMSNNIIQFGDTFWRQKNGTAMGTSCAVNYSFLYIGLLEM